MVLKSFTIGQLAKLTGLTVRALHHYDAVGLLSPSQRSDAGYRHYAQGDIIKLFRIQALQRLGLSLAEIGGVLERAGTALPALIARQLTLLDLQIERATTLRARLSQLQAALACGTDPSADDWLDAVELITFYEDCSPQELGRLLESKNDGSELRALIADVRAAIEEGVPPRSARAGALLDRWAEYMLDSVGGDLQLAIKVKLAYAKDPGLQARMAAQSGIDAEVMLYLQQAAMHKQLGMWRRHLDADQLTKLRPDATWNEQLIRVMGALRSDPASAGLRADWDALLTYFVTGDRALAKIVVQTLEHDRDLQRCWLLEPALLALLKPS